MNKFIIKTLVTVALFTVNNIFNAMMPMVEPYKIYIENHYGAPIKFKTAPPQELAQEIGVANMERVLVANTGYTVRNLSIRTAGIGSSYLSPFTDLTKDIQQLHRESSLDENIYKNAVIIIKPSKSYENWNIQINWENKINTEEMSPEEEMITEIMNGMWGSEYAQKVTAISSYQYYDWANKIGEKPNLNDLLFRYVATFMIDKNEPKLKSMINKLYQELDTYKDLFASPKSK